MSRQARRRRQRRATLDELSDRRVIEQARALPDAAGRSVWVARLTAPECVAIGREVLAQWHRRGTYLDAERDAYEVVCAHLEPFVRADVLSPSSAACAARRAVMNATVPIPRERRQWRTGASR